MSYAEVMNQLRAMSLENFNYIEYLKLVFSNWITGTMFVTCIVALLVCAGIFGYQLWFFKKALKEELID